MSLNSTIYFNALKPCGAVTSVMKQSSLGLLIAFGPLAMNHLHYKVMTNQTTMDLCPDLYIFFKNV